jgi:putative membrane protein
VLVEKLMGMMGMKPVIHLLTKNTNMKKLLFGAFIISGALFTSCSNSSEKSETDSKEIANEQNEQKFDSTKIEDDTEWAVKVADAGMLEVQLAKLALTNAGSSKVKEFAKMMADDHSKANEELKAAATQKNISLPATMSEKCQKKYDELAAKKGADFDKEYMDAMVDHHQESVDNFKKEAEDGKDADLKAWAGSKLPTLQQHLDMAKTTRDIVKK